MKVLESGFNLNWFEFVFVSSLSIEELANYNISIFPNPVKGKFKIQLNDNNEVKALRILDVNGRLVKQMFSNLSSNEYNISSLKSGIYFLIIETEKLQYQKKLIKN